MSYGRKILERVDKLSRDVKSRFNFYLSVSVVEEFKRKCGDRPLSVVLEEMMKDFNETTDEPRPKKRS